MRFADQDYEEKKAENDMPNRREVHTKWGFSIGLERSDPYGFIYIRWPKGPTPAAISGSFTSFDQARIALNTYLNVETLNEIVEEPVTIEKAEVKKRFKRTE